VFKTKWERTFGKNLSIANPTGKRTLIEVCHSLSPTTIQKNVV
jgi:hypothetical protein